jgi:hypothetical protein
VKSVTPGEKAPHPDRAFAWEKPLPWTPSCLKEKHTPGRLQRADWVRGMCLLQWAWPQLPTVTLEPALLLPRLRRGFLDVRNRERKCFSQRFG